MDISHVNNVKNWHFHFKGFAKTSVLIFNVLTDPTCAALIKVVRSALL